MSWYDTLNVIDGMQRQVLDCETECYSEIITHTAVKCSGGCGRNEPEMEQYKQVGLDERVYEDVPDCIVRQAVPLKSNLAYSSSRKVL